MNDQLPAAGRVVSGMRPSGALHLGHYHGVLKNWLQLQQQRQTLRMTEAKPILDAWRVWLIDTRSAAQ